MHEIQHANDTAATPANNTTEHKAHLVSRVVAAQKQIVAEAALDRREIAHGFVRAPPLLVEPNLAGDGAACGRNVAADLGQREGQRER